MSLKKSELSLIKKLDKEISKAEAGAEKSSMKKYIFRITAAHVNRKAEINASSKEDAEEIMFERYGDLPYELIEIH
jgi:hypothetical protein